MVIKIVTVKLSNVVKIIDILAGSVVSDGSANGPGGIDVDLITTDGKTTLQTSTTNEEGHFDFFGVSPGTYVAKISSTHAKKYAFDSDTR